MIQLSLVVVLYLAIWKWSQVKPSLWKSPILITTTILGCWIGITDDSFTDFSEAIHPLQFCLGPAVVAFAIPLYHLRSSLRKEIGSLTLLYSVCTIATVLSGFGLSKYFGIGKEGQLALAVKSVTSAYAIPIMEQWGGDPALAAGIILYVGFFGALIGPKLLKTIIPTMSDRTLGLALGITAHGLGTSRAGEISKTAQSYASLGMIVMGLLTSGLFSLLLGLIAVISN